MEYADLLRERYANENALASQYSGGQLYAEISKLRKEVTLLNGVGTYRFDIKATDITNAYEKTLDRNDVFIPSRIGLFVALQSNEKPSTQILHSYIPVAGENPSVHEVGFINNDAEAIYNGYMRWQIGNGVLFSGYPTERFRKVPQQQGAFVLNSSDKAVNEQIKSEWSIDCATELMIPRIIVAGTRDHNITVNFNGEGLSFACTEGYTPKLVLYMDGFLIKGGCEFYDDQNPNAKAVGRY